MNKEQTIILLDKIRDIHINLMKQTASILDSKIVTQADKNCNLKYEYEELVDLNGVHLQKILGLLFYSKFDLLHKQWHKEYYRLYEILYKKDKSLFSKFKKRKKINSMEMDKCKLYFSELKITTDALTKAINLSKRRVTALSDDAFH